MQWINNDSIWVKECWKIIRKFESTQHSIAVIIKCFCEQSGVYILDVWEHLERCTRKIDSSRHSFSHPENKWALSLSLSQTHNTMRGSFQIGWVRVFSREFKWRLALANKILIAVCARRIFHRAQRFIYLFAFKYWPREADPFFSRGAERIKFSLFLRDAFTRGTKFTNNKQTSPVSTWVPRGPAGAHSSLAYFTCMPPLSAARPSDILFSLSLRGTNNIPRIIL